MSKIGRSRVWVHGHWYAFKLPGNELTERIPHRGHPKTGLKSQIMEIRRIRISKVQSRDRSFGWQKPEYEE